MQDYKRINYGKLYLDLYQRVDKIMSQLWVRYLVIYRCNDNRGLITTRCDNRRAWAGIASSLSFVKCVAQTKWRFVASFRFPDTTIQIAFITNMSGDLHMLSKRHWTTLLLWCQRPSGAKSRRHRSDMTPLASVSTLDSLFFALVTNKQTRRCPTLT